MNLYTATTALVRLANSLEDAVINKNVPEILRLAEECRAQASDIEHDVNSRWLPVRL